MVRLERGDWLRVGAHNCFLWVLSIVYSLDEAALLASANSGSGSCAAPHHPAAPHPAADDQPLPRQPLAAHAGMALVPLVVFARAP